MSGTVTFDFTRQDYRKALQSIAWQRSKKVMAVIALTVAIVVGRSLYKARADGVDAALSPGGVLLLLVLLAYCFFVFGVPLLQSRDKLNDNIFQVTHLQFHQDHIALQLHDGYNERIPYGHIVKASNTDHFAFYWKNSMDAVIVPQHAFSSLSAYREQLSAIDAKLSL